MHFFNLDLTHVSDEIDVVPFISLPHLPLGPVAAYRLVSGKGGLEIWLVYEHARPVLVSLVFMLANHPFLVTLKDIPQGGSALKSVPF